MCVRVCLCVCVCVDVCVAYDCTHCPYTDRRVPFVQRRTLTYLRQDNRVVKKLVDDTNVRGLILSNSTLYTTAMEVATATTTTTTTLTTMTTVTTTKTTVKQQQ